MRISSGDFRRRLLPILLAQLAGLACGLAGVRLTSRLVAPEDYGVYGVAVTVAAVGVSVIYAGLVKFVSRHWQASGDRRGLAAEVAAAALRRAPWLLAATLGAGWLVAPAQAPAIGPLLFGCALLLALAQLAQSALQAARDHWRDFGVSAGMSVVRSFAPPLLYAATGAGVAALLAGVLLQGLTGALLGVWQVAKTWGGRRPEPAPRQLTPVYDGPRFVTLAVAGWVLLGLNRWIIAWFFGAEAAGYYTLAAGIGSVLPTMLGMTLLQYLQPVWFAQAEDTEAARRRLRRDVDLTAALFTGLGLAIAWAVHAAMPWLIGPLVSARYAAAADWVFAAGCSTVAATAGLYYHALLLAAHRERSCSAADLGGAAGLIAGGLASAAAGPGWFKLWLVVSPAVPWLVNRTVAHRAVRIA